jgi:hypothetical protein
VSRVPRSKLPQTSKGLRFNTPESGLFDDDGDNEYPGVVLNKSTCFVLLFEALSSGRYDREVHASLNQRLPSHSQCRTSVNPARSSIHNEPTLSPKTGNRPRLLRPSALIAIYRVSHLSKPENRLQTVWLRWRIAKNSQFLQHAPIQLLCPSTLSQHSSPRQ